MRELERQYDLQPRLDSPARVEGIVLPTHWDNCTTTAHYVKFNRDFYLQHQYLAQVPPTLLQIVADTIDWQLLQRFEYEADT